MARRCRQAAAQVKIQREACVIGHPRPGWRRRQSAGARTYAAQQEQMRRVTHVFYRSVLLSLHRKKLFLVICESVIL